MGHSACIEDKSYICKTSVENPYAKRLFHRYVDGRILKLDLKRNWLCDMSWTEMFQDMVLHDILEK
jgi:hypothetical protein